MQLLGSINHPRLAQAFVDYLATQSIAAQLRGEGDAYQVWVAAEHLSQAQSLFAEFQRDPYAPRYLAASWERTDDAGVSFEYQASVPIWLSFLSQAGPVTLLVLGATLLVFLLQLSFADATFFWLSFFPDPSLFVSFEQWRWITPALMHFGALHILFNCMWWWYLGGRIEAVEGRGALLMLFILGAALPNLAQYLLSGPGFGGLSGVVYALFSYCWLSGRMRPQRGIALSPGLMGFALLWLMVGVLGWFGPPMANAAHLGGLLVGLLLGWWRRNQ